MRILISSNSVIPEFSGEGTRELARWLEGEDSVGSDWLRQLSKRGILYSKPLYRLMTAPKSSKVTRGTIYKVTGRSALVSASDKIKCAVYAGCQWLRDSDQDLSQSKLLLVELIQPLVCATHQQILEALDTYPHLGRSGHVRIRTVNEREYIVLSKGLKGKVLFHTDDCTYIEEDSHRLLLKNLHN